MSDLHYTTEVRKRLKGLLGYNASLLPIMLDDIGHPSEWLIAEEEEGFCLVFSPEANFKFLRFETEAHAVSLKLLLTAAWVSLNDDWSDEDRGDMN